MAKLFDTPDTREWLAGLLPKSAHRHIDTLIDGFSDSALLDTVEISGARMPVETIEAYGLRIALDANGNAVSVESPYGLEVAAE